MMETTTKPFSRLRRRATKRRSKDYCLLEQMLIINAMFVSFCKMWNDVVL